MVKRRYPRREYLSKVGVLTQGKYFIQKTFELGEKGMLFESDIAFREGDKIICNFCLPDGYVVVTQAIVRYITKAKEETLSHIGIEFSNINFEDRRKVRDFIAQRKDKVSEFVTYQV